MEILKLYGIKSKLCLHRLLRRCIRNASAMVHGIKFKLSAFVEGDVEETKGAMRILLLMLMQLQLLHKLRVLKGSFQGIFRWTLN